MAFRACSIPVLGQFLQPGEHIDQGIAKLMKKWPQLGKFFQVRGPGVRGEAFLRARCELSSAQCRWTRLQLKG